MSSVAEIGDLISRNDGIRGGRPIIAGTGVTVKRIVGWYQLGLSPEDIASEIPHLNLAQIYGALTYYHANREEIENDLELDRAEAERLEPSTPPCEASN